MSDIIDSAIESCLICLGRLGKTAELPDELKRRCSNLVRRRRRTEVVKCFDGSAHVGIINTSRLTINYFVFWDYADAQVAILHAARERLCMPIELSAIEKEVILLRAVYALSDDMVNFIMISISGTDPHSEVTFKSEIHLRLFNIMLVDFLSVTGKRGPIAPTSYVSGLQSIAKQPSFDWNDSVKEFRSALAEFVRWLDAEVNIETWLPSIDTTATLKLPRRKFIKMCGNISKHNFLRLISVAEELQELLRQTGAQILLDDALLTLEDFYTKFHRDVIAYHASTIAEFLNNLRWGIYEYLRPEFGRSYTRIPGDPQGRYEYSYPEGVNSKFARSCYWDLMNDIRSAPYLRRFKTTRFLRLHY